MTVKFKSGETCETEYISEMTNGTMFLVLNNKTVLAAAVLLGNADISEITSYQVDPGGSVHSKTYTGYTEVEYVTAQETAARVLLRKGTAV